MNRVAAPDTQVCRACTSGVSRRAFSKTRLPPVVKLLVLASALDLRYRLGCTPAWHHLLKAFHEAGHTVIATSYLGDPVQSPWWTTVPNPCSLQSRAAEVLSRRFRGSLRPRPGLARKTQQTWIRRRVKPAWQRQLAHTLEREGDVELVLFLNAPVNHLAGVPEFLRTEYGVKVAYLDGDMPTILPAFAAARGFRFSYYEGARLDEYDAFFSTSRGALPELRRLGARDPKPLYYAADPDVLRPMETTKTCDVAFYGHGSDLREEWMTHMLADASRAMPTRTFVAAGGGFEIDLGRARLQPNVPFSDFPAFVSGARINLNITRSSHAQVDASSTARPFELASCGATIVSQPYEGIEAWFQPGEELVVVQDGPEALAVYRQLLDDGAERQRLGEAARAAILERHTWRHRVEELLHAV